jgi:hypothetical protein
MARDNHMVIKGRKVWRTTAESPLDEPASAHPVAGSTTAPSAKPAVLKKPMGPGRVRPHDEDSAGIEVSEFAETLPTEIYSALFKPSSQND